MQLTADIRDFVIPKTMKVKAKHFMERHKTDRGELMHIDAPLPESYIVDLLHEVLRKRKE